MLRTLSSLLRRFLSAMFSLLGRWSDLNGLHFTVISSSMVICAIAMELNSWELWSPTITRWLPIPVILTVSISMFVPILAVIKRLLDIMGHRITARPKDLLVITFTYLSIIVGFGVIYAGLRALTGKELFYFSHLSAHFHIVDYLYVSGVTITTIGFGDIVPAYWFTKLLVVVESLAGLWLSATVLGFFVGSLLGSQQQDREARWFRDFQRVYFDALNRFSEAISSMGKLNREEWEALEKHLLDNIANIVKLQYDPLPSAKVSANWMQLYRGDSAPREYLALAQEYTSPQLRNETAMRTVWGILVLREWSEKPSNMPGNGELALPVYDPNDPDQMRCQLPGAPLAVSSMDGYDVVSDVEEMELSNQDASVRDRLNRYFQDHRAELKSFASVRVGYPGGETLGAINIQSSETDLCGTTKEEQRIIVDMIRPFAGYLAALQVNRAEIESGEANEQN